MPTAIVAKNFLWFVAGLWGWTVEWSPVHLLVCSWILKFVFAEVVRCNSPFKYLFCAFAPCYLSQILKQTYTSPPKTRRSINWSWSLHFFLIKSNSCLEIFPTSRFFFTLFVSLSRPQLYTIYTQYYWYCASRFIIFPSSPSKNKLLCDFFLKILNSNLIFPFNYYSKKIYDAWKRLKQGFL